MIGDASSRCDYWADVVWTPLGLAHSWKALAGQKKNIYPNLPLKKVPKRVCKRRVRLHTSKGHINVPLKPQPRLQKTMVDGGILKRDPHTEYLSLLVASWYEDSHVSGTSQPGKIENPIQNSMKPHAELKAKYHFHRTEGKTHCPAEHTTSRHDLAGLCPLDCLQSAAR